MDNDVDYVPCYNDVDEEQDHGSTLLKKVLNQSKGSRKETNHCTNVHGEFSTYEQETTMSGSW